MSLEKETESYFVCFMVSGQYRDAVVEVSPAISKAQLPNTLKELVCPPRPADLSDGMKGQSPRDCTLINFIRLG